MILNALRLCEVGLFEHGVTLEGLKPGLNVLPGPNEHGKSTLVRALKCVFQEAYSAVNASVRDLRSYGGGAPLIEVEFTIEGTRWVLRKRYFAGKFAELSNTATNEKWRNGDAEVMLQQLLGAGHGSASARGLLWVEQTQSFDTPKGREKEQLAEPVASFVRRETAKVAASDAFVSVRRQVRAAIDELVTGKRQQPKKGGPLQQALENRARLEGESRTAHEKFARSMERLETLAALKSQAADLQSPEVRLRLESARADAKKALGEAKQARDKSIAHGFQVRAAQAAFDKATGLLKRYREMLEEADRLQGELTEREHGRKIDLATRDDLLERLDASRKRRVAADTARSEAEALSARAAKVEIAVAKRRELHQLQQTFDVFRAKSAVVARQERELSSYRFDADDVAALRVLGSEVGRLGAALQAASISIEVDYDKGHSGEFRIDGRNLSHGACVRADRPVEISVEGIGRLKVAPGRAEELASWRDDHALRSAELASRLEDCGVGSVDEAEAALALKRQLQEAIAVEKAGIAALVPDGPEALALRLEEARSLLQETDDCNEALPERTVLAAAQEQARCDAETAAADLSALADSLHAVELRLKAHDLRIEAASRRLAELEPELFCDGDRKAHLAALESDASAKREALHVAVIEHDAWRSKALDDEAVKVLERAVISATADIEQNNRMLQDTQVSIAGHHARLEADRDNDVQGEVERLDGALADATKQVERQQQALDSLLLLDSELEAAASDMKGELLDPVLEYLQPMSAEVLGGAEVLLSDPLSVEGLRRQGTSEPNDALSDGTREQISVLVRLAYGRLFAERGLPVPVILDDALVFSDDVRLLKMFEVLKEAARHHQLLVLTCHDRAFEPLISTYGGDRLCMQKWEAKAA